MGFQVLGLIDPTLATGIVLIYSCSQEGSAGPRRFPRLGTLAYIQLAKREGLTPKVNGMD